MANDWRKSAEADELRAYIDKYLRPKRKGMYGLDREIIIDFVAKQITK